VAHEGARNLWLDWHAAQTKFAARRPAPAEQPRVSVCLVHFNRPRLLAYAVDSLRKQDYPNFEVILVDCSSTEPDAQDLCRELRDEFENAAGVSSWMRIATLASARNAAAAQADGDYTPVHGLTTISPSRSTISRLVQAASGQRRGCLDRGALYFMAWRRAG